MAIKSVSLDAAKLDRTTGLPLTYKNTRGLGRLPFAAGLRSRTAAPYWHVPTTCADPFEVGAAMADAYLKHLRENADDCPVSDLAIIVESFMIRFELEGGQRMAEPGRDSRSASYKNFREQCDGFFGTLSAWLTDAARDSSYLDTVSEDLIVQRANDAVQCGAVKQIEVAVLHLPNGVERLASAVVKSGAPHVPDGSRPIDLNEGLVDDFLFRCAEREGFEIPDDADFAGGVWRVGDVTHIRAWLA